MSLYLSLSTNANILFTACVHPCGDYGHCGCDGQCMCETGFHVSSITYDCVPGVFCSWLVSRISLEGGRRRWGRAAIKGSTDLLFAGVLSVQEGWGGYVSSDDHQVSLVGVDMSRGFFVADKATLAMLIYLTYLFKTMCLKCRGDYQLFTGHTSFLVSNY